MIIIITRHPIMHRADLFGKQQAIVLGEYGGLGLPLEGHTWQNKANWGYQSFKDADSLFIQYSKFVDMLAILYQGVYRVRFIRRYQMWKVK